MRPIEKNWWVGFIPIVHAAFAIMDSAAGDESNTAIVLGVSYLFISTAATTWLFARWHSRHAQSRG